MRPGTRSRPRSTVRSRRLTPPFLGLKTQAVGLKNPAQYVRLIGFREADQIFSVSPSTEN
jgi:hypothetical protein